MIYFKNNFDAKVIVVSKTRNVNDIKKILAKGYINFGENYLQEALTKIPQLKDKTIIWHFIGKIQSNKTLEIAKNFDVIHTVDREKIAKKLNTHASDLGKKLDILIQVNIDNEETKSGVFVNDLKGLIEFIKTLKNLNLIGLMCIPQKNSIVAFEKMQKLKNKYNLLELSMGMSADYKQAIKNGATMVRIGTAIFGARK